MIGKRIMKRYFLTAFLGWVSCLTAFAQSSFDEGIHSLFDETAKIKAVTCNYFGSDDLSKILTFYTPIIDRAFLERLASFNAQKRTGHRVEIPYVPEEQSLLILSIPSEAVLSSSECKLLESLFTPMQFDDCELITFASEAGEQVKIFGIRESGTPSFRGMYVLYTNDKQSYAMRLLGRFALNSSIHLSPVSKK